MIIIKIAGIVLLWILGMFLHEYTRKHGHP